MGMAQGLLNAYKANEQRDKEEEAQAKLDALNSENMRLKKLDMALKYSNTRAKSFTGAGTSAKGIPSVQESLMKLKKIGIPDNTILKIAGGGAGDLDKIYKKFGSTVEEHKKNYGDAPFDISMFINALEEAVITQPESYKLDIEEVEKLFEFKATEAETLMFPQGITPRQSISLQPGSVNVIPALSPKDLTAALKAVSTNVIITAAEELQKYQNTMGQFPSEDAEVNKWLATRVGQIKSGISKATGDIPILTDLFGLFGNSYASQYIGSKPILKNAAKMGDFPRAYSEAAERPDIDLTVPIDGIGNLSEHGAKIYNYLMQNSLVPVGTRIKFVKTDGTEYNHLVTEELLEEFNR
tara:strand:+ start:750 stop:1811 length:1062 start_codon:yes stop_codon:yes gene_type:complete